MKQMRSSEPSCPALRKSIFNRKIISNPCAAEEEAPSSSATSTTLSCVPLVSSSLSSGKENVRQAHKTPTEMMQLFKRGGGGSHPPPSGPPLGMGAGESSSGGLSDLARIGDALDDMSVRIGTSLSNYDDLRACLNAADVAHEDGGIPALEAARDRLQAWIRTTR